MASILAIDTSTDIGSIALGDYHEGKAIVDHVHHHTYAVVAGHAEQFLPALQRLLTTAHLTPSAFSLIAVNRGPGSFAGVRMGLASARALCLVSGATLLAATRLEMMVAAMDPPHEDNALVLALADASRGEFFAGAYRYSSRCLLPVCVEEPLLLSGTDIASWYAHWQRTTPEAVSVVGDTGVAAHAHPDTSRWVLVPPPSAEVLLSWALRTFQSSADGSIRELAPCYVRAPNGTITPPVPTK